MTSSDSPASPVRIRTFGVDIATLLNSRQPMQQLPNLYDSQAPRAARVPASCPALLVQPFPKHRHSLAAAHPHRLQADRFVFRREAVQQGAEDASPGHAEGMAERNRAAVRIQLVTEGVDA